MSPEDQLERGVHFLEQGQYEAARRDLEAALEGNPALLQAYLYLFRNELAENQWEAALEVLNRALQHVSSPEGQKLITEMVGDLIANALAQIRQGQTDQAIAMLRDGLRRLPDSSELARAWVDALLTYGKELLARGDWQRAIEQFTQALEHFPKELEAYLGLARALLSSGDIMRALEAIRDALKLAPNDPGAKELMRELIRV